MNQDWTPPAPIPPKSGPGDWLRSLKTFRSQIEGLPERIFTQSAWRPPIPGTPFFVTAPELIEQALLTQADSFTHGDLLPRMMRPAWGKGMFLAEGEAWRAQRQAAAPAFRAREIETLVHRFVAATEKMLARWLKQDGAEVELHGEMQRLTFEIIVDVLLSGGEGFDSDMMRRDVAGLFAEVNHIRASYILMPDSWHASRPPIRSEYRVRIMSHIRSLIRTRRSSPARGDLIDLLLKATDPQTGEALSDELLADNLLGFVVAGFMTTAVALSWTLWLATSHAPTRERLGRELAEVLGDQPLTAQSLGGLTFAGQVIKESLRLYPPAHTIARVSQDEAELGGHRIRPGQRIIVRIYAVHRHAAQWTSPHGFDPARFSPDQQIPQRFAFMPFGGGPRICIGLAFAMTEITCVLATLLRVIDIRIANDTEIWPQAGVVLYPRNGIRVRISAKI